MIPAVFFGFDCVSSFHSGGYLVRRARVQSQVEGSEPKGNLDGFLACLHRSHRNEGKSQEFLADALMKGCGWVLSKGGKFAEGASLSAFRLVAAMT